HRRRAANDPQADRAVVDLDVVDVLAVVGIRHTDGNSDEGGVDRGCVQPHGAVVDHELLDVRRPGRCDDLRRWRWRWRWRCSALSAAAATAGEDYQGSHNQSQELTHGVSSVLLRPLADVPKG